MTGENFSVRYMMNQLTGNPSRLFLLDSSGAFLDACLLGGVLAAFPQVFGMPSAVLYVLSAVAFLYAIYSISCFFFVSDNWRPWLTLVAAANILHGLVTIGLVVYYYHHLTVWGLTFFVLETITLGCVVFLELKALRGA